MAQLDAHVMVQSSGGGPAKARQALLWMQKNLYLELDLTLAKMKRSQAHGPIELGARQAPVAPPGVLLRLDNILTHQQAEVCVRPSWIAACGAWAMTIGVVRLRH